MSNLGSTLKNSGAADAGQVETVFEQSLNANNGHSKQANGRIQNYPDKDLRLESINPTGPKIKTESRQSDETVQSSPNSDSREVDHSSASQTQDVGERDRTQVEENDQHAGGSHSSAEDCSKKTKPEKFAIELTADKLVSLMVEKSNVEFFRDQHGVAFAWIPTPGDTSKFECLRIDSNEFHARIYLLGEAYATKQPSPAILKQAIQVTELKAFKGPRRDLANRRKSDKGKILIDIGDTDRNMLSISKNGWSVQLQKKPRFIRPLHQLAMASPIGGGDPQKLFDFFSVDTEDDKLLVLAWTLAALCPDVPVPMLLLIGTQGSAKTTRSRRLRSLLDPSVTPVLGDIDMSNLFLTFDNHALPCFENVSKFNRSTADMFCRAVTGNYVERRKLFTNSDQVLYSFQRPIIINGIDAPSTRPDFLDRCIAINCRRMKTFKPIRELDAAFEAARPKLLGSLLDLLVKTLKEMKHLPVAGKFRMADFAHFGRAMTVALGRDPEEFDTAYLLNIKHQDQEILEATPMTSAVTLFAKSYTEDNPWKGTAGELLILLRDKAHTSSDKDATSDLPKNARWLSCRLSELVTALAANGVIIDRLPRTKQSRGWKVYATGEVGIKGDPKKANRDLIEEMGTPAIVDQDEST